MHCRVREARQMRVNPSQIADDSEEAALVDRRGASLLGAGAVRERSVAQLLHYEGRRANLELSEPRLALQQVLRIRLVTPQEHRHGELLALEEFCVQCCNRRDRVF